MRIEDALKEQNKILSQLVDIAERQNFTKEDIVKLMKSFIEINNKSLHDFAEIEKEVKNEGNN